MPEEPPRHPGAGRLAWSRAVHHQVPIGGKVLRSPGNLVVRYPDRARDNLAILTPALRPPDVENGDWLVTAQPLGEDRGVHDIGAVPIRKRHWLALFRAYAVLIRKGVPCRNAPSRVTATSTQPGRRMSGAQ